MYTYNPKVQAVYYGTEGKINRKMNLASHIGEIATESNCILECKTITLKLMGIHFHPRIPSPE